MKDKRILMLINEFPPVGESGVQRPLKFLKHLARSGWDCLVVTPSQPTKTVLDRSLCREIPQSARIIRTPSWGLRGKSVDLVASIRQKSASVSIKGLSSRLLMRLNHMLFPIDKQIGWVPFAFIYALYLIKRYKLRNLYITAFPFSAMMVGILLKKCLGDKLFWVADYRDGWQFEPLIESVLPKRRMRFIRWMDEQVLRHCDKAVFVTESIRCQYIKAYPWMSKRAELITNGYDEDDFADLVRQSFETPTLVYMGKIYNLNRPNLLPLLDALKGSDLSTPLIHIGSLALDARAQIERNGYDFYNFKGYKTHREALSIAAGAAVNLLLLNDDKVSEGVYTGKVFELLRLGPPILALGPKQGLVKELIETSGAGVYVWVQDSEAIIPALKRLLEHPESYRCRPDILQNFRRSYLTERLAALYE